MSSQASIHIAPFVHCKFVEVEKFHTNTFCEACKMHKNGKFCSSCGGPITERKHGYMTSPVSCGELRDKMEEAMWTPFDEYRIEEGIDIWLSNKNLDDLDDISFYPRDGNVLSEITPEKILKNLEIFEEYHKDHIKMLEEAYGAENVSIHYGVINSIS